MVQSAEKKAEENRATLLPEDARSALKIMSQLTRQMLEYFLEEGKMLKNKDTSVLALVQKGKELRVDGYTRAAMEFQARREEFRDVDPLELDKLDALTRELGKAARDNQVLIEALAPKKPLHEQYVNNLFLLQGQIDNEKAQ